MIIIGLMSGTSIDAIDVACARFLMEGSTLVLERLGFAEMAWPAATRDRLLAALPPAPVTMGEVCALDVLAGEAFAEAAAMANERFCDGQAALVASHGQTLFHWIEDGQARGTLQLGQPAIIAERLGLPVVSDFRARDIAAGGQGAPLASTLDALWLADGEGARAALNLGGIANITVVRGPDAPMLAYDTGPASCLLDVAAARISNGRLACDLDGRMALAGRVRVDLLARLLAEPYYARSGPKSTGRELFDRHYMARHVAGLGVSDVDLMATLTELTARTVAEACLRERVEEVVASGGGTRNPALMAALRRCLGGIALTTSAARGLPEDAKEAYLFALLGWLSWHGLPGTVVGATGGAPRVLGRITPGMGGRVGGWSEQPVSLMLREAIAPAGG